MAEKRYDFVSTQRVGESTGKVLGKEVYKAVAVVSGFLAKDPEEFTTKSGKKGVRLALPLNNTGKRLTGSLGLEPADETLWLNPVAYDNENVTLATRLQKAVKARTRVALSLDLNVTEYNGKAQINAIINDFDVIYDGQKYRFPNEYSWVNARFGEKEGEAIMNFRGRLGTEPEMRETKNGKKFLSFSVPMSKTGSKMNYALGVNGKAGETEWLNVRVWENDHGFNLMERAEKALHKGNHILAQGRLTTNTSEDGKVYYNLDLSNFEKTNNGDKVEKKENDTDVVVAPSNESNNVAKSVPQTVDPQDDPFGYDSYPIDIDDDDLPF